jgi:hypothetical protein
LTFFSFLDFFSFFSFLLGVSTASATSPAASAAFASFLASFLAAFLAASSSSAAGSACSRVVRLEKKCSGRKSQLPPPSSLLALGNSPHPCSSCSSCSSSPSQESPPRHHPRSCASSSSPPAPPHRGPYRPTQPARACRRQGPVVRGGRVVWREGWMGVRWWWWWGEGVVEEGEASEKSAKRGRCRRANEVSSSCTAICCTFSSSKQAQESCNAPSASPPNS